MTHNIIKIERATTKKGDPMWRCNTQEGDRVNIFKGRNGHSGSYDLFTDYHTELDAMNKGDVINWRLHPIQVTLQKDGNWFNITAVSPRPDHAYPDPSLKPDVQMVRESIQSWWQRFTDEATEHPANIVIWDTETTGTDPAVDQIISIGAVNLAGEPVIDTLIRPKNPQLLTPESIAVHGITREQLQDAPSFSEVYAQICVALNYTTWIIYNQGFDTTVLERDCYRWDLRPPMPFGVIDTMELFARYNGEWNSEREQFVNQTLSYAAAHFEIDASDAHNALADAKLTLGILQAMGQGKKVKEVQHEPF